MSETGPGRDGPHLGSAHGSSWPEVPLFIYFGRGGVLFLELSGHRGNSLLPPDYLSCIPCKTSSQPSNQEGPAMDFQH